MDIITDLASEAVNYITVIQDIYNIDKSIGGSLLCFEGLAPMHIRKPSRQAVDAFEERITELVWSSESVEVLDYKKEIFEEATQDIFSWLIAYSKTDFETFAAQVIHGQKKVIPITPEEWRFKIKAILYKSDCSRTELAAALNYMPVQVVFAIADKQPKAGLQRLYQLYLPQHIASLKNNPNLKNALLNAADCKRYNAFWRPVSENKEDVIRQYLTDEEKLLNDLEDNMAVPFLTLFNRELQEIVDARAMRLEGLTEEDIDKFPVPLPTVVSNGSPDRRADDMKLAGLAFSGGGIRSATFNLGVLQKLAETGALPRFDYLSTVSGGGYIGSWFSTWIKHDRSLTKVIDRLDTTKSSDPLAEEVRPVRWLRMFSNYLSPNSSIMSVDAWTVGVTWLRNTLINQVVLLLILLTVLSFINLMFRVWAILKSEQVHFTIQNVLVYSSVIMIVGVILATAGMRTYNMAYPAGRLVSFGKNAILAQLLIIWTVVVAMVVTWWLCVEDCTRNFALHLSLLWPAAIPVFFGMIIIAYVGGYHRLEEKVYKRSIVPILLSSLFASAGGVVVLACAWELIGLIRHHNADDSKIIVFGIPMIIEAICITIVIRMALMGKYFPDERREWWGRMGAVVHRFMFWWIIVSAAALLLPPYLKCPDLSIGNISIFASWSAFISFAVRYAYTSKTSDGEGAGFAQYKDIIVRVAPYVFMVGFLLLGSFLIEIIEKEIPDDITASHLARTYLILTIFLGLLTAGLSWRVGVNEFSLHDFYRNRLVRGYLAAARRRTDREKTANSFTNFDRRDDQPLADYCTKKGYCGPYPLINTTLNASTVSELDRQDRKAESFIFSPLYSGFDFNNTSSSASSKSGIFKYGYRPTVKYSAKGGPNIGTAMAISGAAVSPNMGYHSSSATSFLLTIFNVRLGRWTGNPRRKNWQKSEPRFGLSYLLKDLVGNSDIDSDYVYLSDGGHFDNMGLYELIRRRCTYIVLGDAEEDHNASCEGLANAIRRCRIDFGVQIEIDVKPITDKIVDTGFSKSHVRHGVITYPDKKKGKLVYIKSTLTGDEETDVREYYLKNTKFPHESTGDQFFNEAQFESYRKLGYHSVTANALKYSPK